MKVYCCYEHYYDNCEVWDNLVRIFDSESKALDWKNEIIPTDKEWREYLEWEVK